MLPSQGQQLEKLIDEALKRNDFHALEELLRGEESSTEVHQKGSKQFVSKLDRLINRELDKRNAKHASLCLSCLPKFGKSLTVPGGPLLTGNGAQGLIKKIIVSPTCLKDSSTSRICWVLTVDDDIIQESCSKLPFSVYVDRSQLQTRLLLKHHQVPCRLNQEWYGKALELWLGAGLERNETVLTLAEDFFDALMVVHEASYEGRCQVTETFLHPVGLLAADTRVHITIQKEAVRKLNLILDKIPPVLKKERKIFLSAEVSVVMDKLASRILEGGDYDLQIALMESICRMTGNAQRLEHADRWFTMEFVSSAFCKIKDSEFETDCRKFLNLVNGMQGDKSRVHSYPCLEVFLGKHELVMPMDDKLDEFWIDFNLGSRSISFYYSLSKEDTQEGQWDTMCIPENELQTYAVEEARGRKVLVLVLNEPMTVGSAEGSKLQIHFSQTLDVLQAATNVYGNDKLKRFVGKTSGSVVKTTVQIVLDESSSQVLVPESQVSQGLAEPRLSGTEKSVFPPLPPAQDEAAGKPLPPLARPHPAQLDTPARWKLSESSTFISSAGRSVGQSPSISVLQSTTPLSRAKVKPALDLVSSSGKKFDIRELMITQTHESTYCSIRREQRGTFGLVGGKIIRQIPGALPADKFHRNISVDKVVEMVQTEQEDEEQILDDNTNMVPDSQPVWRKQGPPVLPPPEMSEIGRKRTSVSELALQERTLTKARALPAPLTSAPPLGTSSALTQDQCTQPFPTVGLQKQSTQLSGFELHVQLTQRLEGLRRGRENARRSGGQEEEEEEEEDQPAGAESQTRRGTPVPEQRSAVRKSAQLTVDPNNSSLTKKPRKSGPVAVTSSMAAFISSHYKTPTAAPAVKSGTGPTPTSVSRSNEGKGWTFPSLGKGTDKTSGFPKTANESNKPAENPECDIYSFQSESPESWPKGLQFPEKSIGEKSVQQLLKRVSTSGKKSTVAKPRGDCARKHLFSDTETEKTDISWLKESSRKPKPKVLNYGRQRATKPPPPANTTYDLGGTPSPSPQPETQAKQKKRKNTRKERKQSPVVAQVSQRPQRTSALSKNYKEPSEFGSSSQSESEDVTHCPPKQNQTNGNTKWSVMDQQLELKKNPVPAKKHREKPFTLSKHLEKPATASEHGEKPITAEIYGEKPFTLSKHWEKPATASEHGEKPITADIYGEKPFTLSKHWEKPATASEHGEKSITADIYGEKPFTLSKHLVKPVTANEQGGKPITAIEQGGKAITENKIGKKLVTAMEQMKKTVTANKQRKRLDTAINLEEEPVTENKLREEPVTVNKLREEPVTTSKQGRKPVTGSKQGRKPVTANDLEKKPLTENKQGGKPVPANKRGGKPVTANKRGEKPVIANELEEKPVVEDPGRGQKESWSARLNDFLPSPPPIERMRSTRNAAEAGSPISPLQSPDALSFPLEVAPSFTGIQASSFYRSERGGSTRKTPSAPSPSHLQAVPTPILSPPHPLQNTSPPLLTSTALQLSVPNSPFPESSLSLPACLESLTSSSSQSIPPLEQPSSHDQIKEHVSGPGLCRKRPPSHHSSSTSEDEENEEMRRGSGTEQRMSMQPRKLFKAREEEEEEEEEKEDLTPEYSQNSQQKEGGQVRQERGPTVAAPGQGEGLTHAVRNVELCSVVSSHVVSSFWESNMEGDGDLEAQEFDASSYMSSMCQQFNSELKRKVQNRSRRMDHFAKQSLKTVQQHVSSVSVQIHQYRSQKMEKIRNVLLEEICNLEQDNSNLKDAEKELTTYWKKQTHAFHSYQERENKRLQNVRSTFQKNVCHSIEYEEQIFTSEMCLMREDMKSAQDKLFKDMQEEEMLSVRRGLQALFLPEGCRF